MTSFPSSHFSCGLAAARPNFGCGSFTREDVFFPGDKLSGGVGVVGISSEILPWKFAPLQLRESTIFWW